LENRIEEERQENISSDADMEESISLDADMEVLLGKKNISLDIPYQIYPIEIIYN